QPMRRRAYSTITLRPATLRSRAAARPAAPAPITNTTGVRSSALGPDSTPTVLQYPCEFFTIPGLIIFKMTSQSGTVLVEVIHILAPTWPDVSGQIRLLEVNMLKEIAQHLGS